MSYSPSFTEESNINGVLPIGLSTVFITNLCGKRQHQTGRPLGKLPHVFFTSLYGEKQHQRGPAHRTFHCLHHQSLWKKATSNWSPLGKLPHVFFTSLYGEKHQLSMVHEKFP